MKKTITILVVDDDPNLRKTLSDIMRVKGYTVVSAANGAAAIAESQQTAVNVALIDLMLPDMSGIEVMERIKTGSPHTEAIILTGHASLATAIEATTKGAYSYLLKPYEIENLLLHIRHAIDRQQAQEEIRRLASFPRLNPQAVIELAPSGEVTYANPAADKLFPDLRLQNGQHPLLIGLGDIYATFRQGNQMEMVRETAIGGSSYEKHLYYVPESGLIRITVIDVTERKRAEESLRKLSQAVEQSPSAIVITDLNANIEYVNEGFVKITGYSRAEVAGQNPRLLHSGKTPGETYKEMWASLKRGEMWKGELINRRKDGSEYIESALMSPVRQADGRVTHYLAIKEDITERKRMEAEVLQLNEELESKVAARTADLEHARIEAEQANRAKSEFLVNMSHEIRTPMNGVVGMIDILKQSGLNDGQIEMANIIRDSAFALLAVIDDILDFSRIEAGKLQIHSTPMAIASVMEGVCETLDSLAGKYAVELILSIDPAIPAQLQGDPRRLRQILLKLVNNAIKFSGRQQRHGRVSVRAMLVESNATQATLEFRVTDNGIGMDAATQARLFTAFTQADTSTTRSFGGAGLGLAISSQLANIMGGEIRVQSEPGAGATFILRLPFALPPAPSSAGTMHIAAGGDRMYGLKAANGREDPSSNERTAPSPLSHEKARQRGSLILIAEDNEINQKVILQQLALLGFAADVAGDGRLALERWRSRGYALLLTDLHMPEMDGYKLTEAIRAGEAEAGETNKPHMPIIAITANALKGEAEHCRAVGMDDYLSKPVQLADLKAMLEKWLPVAESTIVATNPLPNPTPGGRRAKLPSDGTASHSTSPSNDNGQVAGYPTGGGIDGDGEGEADGTTSPSPAPVDVNVLKALVGDDDAMIRDFLHDFRISAAKIATELKAACNGEQAAQAGALAHKLKSSARSMGALALGELCAAMEQAGKACNAEALSVLLPEFETEMTAVDEYLGLFLKK